MAARKKKVDPTMTGDITQMAPALQEVLGDTPFKVIDIKCARCGTPMVLTSTMQLCSIQCPRPQEDTEMPYYKVMATGHREVKAPEHQAQLEATMADILMYLSESHPEILGVSGGALGIDTTWARVCYRNNIPYDVWVPYQYENVFIARMGRYNPAKSQAECVVNLRKFRKMLELAHAEHRGGRDTEHGTYTAGDNNRRNHAMVKMSNAAVVVCKFHPHEVLRDKSIKGGTIDAIRKLAKEGFEDVFYIDWHNPAGYTMVNLQDFG